MNPRRVRRVERPVIYGRPQASRRSAGFRRPERIGLGLLPRRLIVLAAGLLVVWLALGQLFGIKNIRVEASSDRSNQIEGAARKLVAARWRQQNVLTLDASALEDELLKSDPMLKSVEIRRQWPNGIKVSASLKQPSLGWVTGNAAYLLDRDGSAIGTLPQGSNLPVVVDGSNLPVKLGEKVTSSRFVGFMVELAPELQKLGLAPASYEVKETTLDLYVTTAKKYKLVLDTSRPVGEQLSDLKTLVGFLNKQGKTPAEYIDLRIAGKAYYK